MSTEKIQLTHEQRIVVESADSRITVVASAGAGKTRVLVERYLRHVIVDDIRPFRILTITFTRKAAAEMKGRIVQGLRDAGRLEDAQIAETGPIQTIHSFCERLLRENSIEAGVDPAFEILGEAQSSRFQTEAIEAALGAPPTDQPEAEALITSLAGRRRYGASRTAHAVLRIAIEDVLSQLRGAGTLLNELEETHISPSHLSGHRNTALLDQLDIRVRELMGDSCDDLQPRLQAAFKEAMNKVPPWAKTKAGPESEAEALRNACGLVQLAAYAWKQLENRMDRLQRFDFTYLESRAVTLVERSERTRSRLREQFDVVMVDEAQDLNPVQYRLLANIRTKCELLVGDGQQSIYGFRHADVSLFRQHEKAPKRLSKNFRSQAGILSFVDFLFENVWGDQYGRMTERKLFELDLVEEQDFTGVEFWEYPSKDLGPTAHYVKELLDEGLEPNQIAVLTRNTASCALIHEQLQFIGVPSRIVGGSARYYTRMEVRDMANTLRALADPYDDLALLACLRSPMAGLSMDAIVLLATNKPVIDAFETVELPEEDAEKLLFFRSWYEPLRSYADRLSAWEAISEVLAKSPYMISLAKRRTFAQQLPNVRKLLALAAQEPELGPLEFAEEIREIQDLRHKEGDAPMLGEAQNVVTIMTIHKAKGLEFDVVVLPETNRKFVPRAREVVSDARLGLVATNFAGNDSLFYRFLTDRAKEKSREEELRVLYVALTRAKQRLCIALYNPTSDDNASKRIRTILGEPFPPSIRVRRRE
ncbi:MAG TPA: UvrD-helicase domain-containing protein [Fimbriimonas sp.]|nr:UvrD-helicase domain-containing protein [Fimbriimonas sp.]